MAAQPGLHDVGEHVLAAAMDDAQARVPAPRLPRALEQFASDFVVLRTRPVEV